MKTTKQVEALLGRVRMSRDATRVLSALRRRGRVAVVSAILERRPQRWSAEVEPRAHRRSWSGLPPMLVDRPSAYRVTIDGKRYSAAGLVQLIKLGYVQPIRRRWYVRGRFRLACTPERLRRILEGILTAPTPARLEQAFQVSVRLFRWSGRIDEQRGGSPADAAKEAMHERGRQLCRTHPLGRLVPRFEQRRRRLTIGRSSYRVGRGYNGAGVRYVWAWAKDWALATWKRRGVPANVADDVWEWWSKYPHRALRALEGIKSRKARKQ